MVTETRRWMARSSFNSELERNEKGVLQFCSLVEYLFFLPSLSFASTVSCSSLVP
jgi:hypothetical protein